jgi:protein dithiol oxidoreductase (disulfide-forming)
MQRRDLLKFMALGCVAPLSVPVLAQQGAPYVLLPNPVPKSAPDGKLEVIEFFSYGCPHCHDFEPLLNEWHKKQAPDVDFVRVPITFGRKQWETYARLYLAFEVLEKVEALHAKAFDAIHLKKVPLHDEKGIRDWATAQGEDGDRLVQTLKSFAVQSRLQKSLQVAEAYQVNSVPLLAVEGRFLVSGSQAGSFANMLTAMDGLLKDARKARTS